MRSARAESRTTASQPKVRPDANHPDEIVEAIVEFVGEVRAGPCSPAPQTGQTVCSVETTVQLAPCALIGSASVLATHPQAA